MMKAEYTEQKKTECTEQKKTECTEQKNRIYILLLVLILHSFHLLAAFHLELLQAILFIPI